MYYLRTRAAVDAIKFTVNQEQLAATLKKQAMIQSSSSSNPAEKMTQEEKEMEALKAMVCSLENPEACTMCSG